jgi:hypothetical protein
MHDHHQHGRDVRPLRHVQPDRLVRRHVQAHRDVLLPGLRGAGGVSLRSLVLREVRAGICRPITATRAPARPRRTRRGCHSPHATIVSKDLLAFLRRHRQHLMALKGGKAVSASRGSSGQWTTDGYWHSVKAGVKSIPVNKCLTDPAIAKNSLGN